MPPAKPCSPVAGLPRWDHAFGRRTWSIPIRHLLASASGWGGLPEQEAYYLNVDLGLPVGEYKVTVRDVPVDGFWSISVYNAAGYFEPNDRNAYSVNNITATPDDDGSITVHSAAAPTTDPTACPSWTAGTTPSACTGPDPRSSTEAGPSQTQSLSHELPGSGGPCLD